MLGIRLDRLTTIHFSWPIVRLMQGRGRTRIPILMYHAVADGSSDPRPYYETNVSPCVFAKQMLQLRKEGYATVSLDAALEALRSGEPVEKRVAITFDDGYLDFYENAFPILSEHGFTATVFLTTGFTGEPHLRLRFKDKECLTWSKVRELHEHGIMFGSHTVTHPQLKDLEQDHIEVELRSSKQMIEDQIGAAVRSFSYPYAFPEVCTGFVRNLKEILMTQGYQNGVTTIIGTANHDSDCFFLPRLPVNTWDDPCFFQAKLEGGYDWLHGAQYLSKLAGRLRPSHPEEKAKTMALS